MDIYIDFDRTLFDTTSMIEDIDMSLAKELKRVCNLKTESQALDLFKTEKEQSKGFSNLWQTLKSKYNIEAFHQIEKTLLKNKDKYIFEDSKRFLKKCRESGNKVILFTFSEQKTLNFQMLKIYSSAISSLFDSIFVTSTEKWKVNIDYKNSMFIDDNPEVLDNIFENGAKKVIRIARIGEKFSCEKLRNNIETYASLDEIKI